MAEYIDREKLYNNLILLAKHQTGERQQGILGAAETVRLFSAADVAPVVHGRWEYIPQTLNTLSQLRCPFCRWWSLDPSIDGVYNYCPNCGAKMDGGDDGETD